MLFNQILLFLIGFYILVKGAGLLVRGASSVARIFGMPTWVIGMIIVGMGTSLPELAISLASAFKGGEIAVGMIVGSNMVNTFLVLGILALFSPMTVKEVWVKKDFLLVAGSVLLVSLFAYLPIFGTKEIVGLVRGEGVILFIIFIIWIWQAIRRKEASLEEDIDQKALTSLTSISFILLGIIGVFFGGQWVVNGAKEIASILGISSTLIALTAISLGTSLPEFVVSFTALKNKDTSMALGNIIGSNIFNFLGILSIASIFRPLPFSYSLIPDISLAFLSIVILSIFIIFVGKKYKLERWQGGTLIIFYLIYLIFIFYRG